MVVGSIFNLGVEFLANAAFSLAAAAAAADKEPVGYFILVLKDELWWLFPFPLWPLDIFPLNIDFKDEDNIDLIGVEVAVGVLEADMPIPEAEIWPLLNLDIIGLRKGDLSGNFNSRPCISSLDKGMAM